LLSNVILVAFVGSLIALALVSLGLYDARKLAAEYLKREAAANDRLYAAWRDGYSIPPADPEPVAPDPPLIAGLQRLINDWDDDEGLGAKAQERVIRQYMATGMSQEDVLKLLLPAEVVG
jgi:hypothetical protein